MPVATAFIGTKTAQLALVTLYSPRYCFLCLNIRSFLLTSHDKRTDGHKNVIRCIFVYSLLSEMLYSLLRIDSFLVSLT